MRLMMKEILPEFGRQMGTIQDQLSPDPSEMRYVCLLSYFFVDLHEDLLTTASDDIQVAETLGVVADPELYVKKLTKSDKYVIIASDGVWEFLTNQAVLDIVDKSVDPLEACNAVIDQAYELWLRFDVRTDDITMICIRIDVDKVCRDRDSVTGSPDPISHHPLCPCATTG